jgi:hypothetical protein
MAWSNLSDSMEHLGNYHGGYYILRRWIYGHVTGVYREYHHTSHQPSPD